MLRLQPSLQRGFSLLELSVATAIYSMGLGSLSLLMLLAVHGTVEARDRSLASIHASELAEMILMQSDAVGHYLVEPAVIPPDCGLGSECSEADVAAYHLGAWRSGLARDLRDGRGLVCLDASPEDGEASDPACDGMGGPVVKVFWRTPGGETSPGAGRVTVTVPVR